MMTIIIFSVIGGLLVLSIIFSSIAHSKQQELALNKSKINQLARSIFDLEETLNTILRTDSSYELILILHQQLLTLTEKKLALEPKNKKTLRQLEQQKALNAKFRNGERENTISKALQSDEAINVANFHLQQVANLLHKFRANKKLSTAKFNELSKHILKLRLDIEVESHIAQADRYSEKHDYLLAQDHLKQARESLRTFSGDFPEKSELINSLAQRIKEIRSSKSNTSSSPTDHADCTDNATDATSEHQEHPSDSEQPVNVTSATTTSTSTTTTTSSTEANDTEHTSTESGSNSTTTINSHQDGLKKRF